MPVGMVDVRCGVASHGIAANALLPPALHPSIRPLPASSSRPAQSIHPGCCADATASTTFVDEGHVHQLLWLIPRLPGSRAEISPSTCDRADACIRVSPVEMHGRVVMWRSCDCLFVCVCATSSVLSFERGLVSCGLTQTGLRTAQCLSLSRKRT